jgi:aminoglycoside phosphotransferase (APT) family kinase protein
VSDTTDAAVVETGRPEFQAALAAVLARITPGDIVAATRLSGGANMESWSIDWRGADGAMHGYILRRAPSDAWMSARPFDLESEAALVMAARACGVRAPRVCATLCPDDGLGHGYIMARVEAEVAPAAILSDPPPTLIDDIAAALAAIHAMPGDTIPATVPVMDVGAALAELRARFIAYGGDRPVIALALHWLAHNIPDPAPPVLVHGDFRIGNLMVRPGAQGGLAAVLDWELAHIGDAHEDIAYGCMTVWRFGAIDRPAFGVADLERYFAAYSAASGREVDPARFHFWLVYRTTWWALGCLQMGAFWRDGTDATLERAVISRRTSEQELDLLLLLETEAPVTERTRPLPASAPPPAPASGEASARELISAVSQWIASDVKARASGRDKFLAAVAINALGMVERELAFPAQHADAALAAALLDGRDTLATPHLLARLRRAVLDKLGNDVPKYPALARARAAWGDTAPNSVPSHKG